jgi:hypothetical protein
MEGIGVRNWMMLLCVAGLLLLTGCDISLQEAAQAGVFDFVAGTITDTLTALLPIAATVGDSLASASLP